MGQRMTAKKKKNWDTLVASAAKLYLERDIESVHLTDVAADASMGVATLYRYFDNKMNLTVLAAEQIIGSHMEPIIEDAETCLATLETGYDQVKALLHMFLRLQTEGIAVLRFIESFDRYVVSNDIDPDQLVTYEVKLRSLSSYVRRAIANGISDGSIRPNLDVETFEFTIGRTIVHMSMKVSLFGKLLAGDEQVAPEAQIQLLIDMAMRYIEN